MARQVSGLESARLKVARATEHIGAINRIVTAIASRTDSYELVKDLEGRLVVRFLADPPEDISILAGEAIYQLRSALDHLVFNLVDINQTRVVLPSNWFKRCEFPLWTEIPVHQINRGNTCAPLPYKCFSKSLPGISKAAFEFIESLQPYRTGEGNHNVMRILAKLSNIDKHRHLTPILPRIAVHDHFKSSSGLSDSRTVGGLKNGSEVPLIEIPSTSERVWWARSFSPYVTFDEIAVGCGPDTLEAQDVLGTCLQIVKSVVVPTFDKLINGP